jgi:hypothetical protein
MSLPLFAVGLAVTAAVLAPKKQRVGAVTLRSPNAGLKASLAGQYVPSGYYVMTPPDVHCPPGYQPAVDIYSIDGRKFTMCMRQQQAFIRR